MIDFIIRDINTIHQNLGYSDFELTFKNEELMNEWDTYCKKELTNKKFTIGFIKEPINHTGYKLDVKMDTNQSTNFKLNISIE